MNGVESPFIDWLNTGKLEFFISYSSYSAQQNGDSKAFTVRGIDGIFQLDHPEKEGFKEALEILEQDRQKYLKMFHDIITNQAVDLRVIRNLIDLHTALGHWNCFSLDRMHFYVAPVIPNPTIQDYIELEYILVPSLNKNNNMLSMLCICSYCQNLFIAKTNRSYHCSPSCRVMLQRKRNSLR